jgi:hypothetical protein
VTGPASHLSQGRSDKKVLMGLHGTCSRWGTCSWLQSVEATGTVLERSNSGLDNCGLVLYFQLRFTLFSSCFDHNYAVDEVLRVRRFES